MPDTVNEEGLLVEKIFPSGGWCISEIRGRYAELRRYFDYTREEAVAAFREEFPVEEEEE
jgi:hypothetical protein